MAEDDQRITLGEVYRGVEAIRQMMGDLVTRKEFLARLENFDQRLTQMDHDLANKATSAATEHARLDADRDKDINAIRLELQQFRDSAKQQSERIADQEEKRKASNRTLIGGLVLAGFSFLLTIARDVLGLGG